MPIIAIIEQPGRVNQAKVVAAYRPVVFKVNATRSDGNKVPPVVYCDIYFNQLFYKTLAHTQYDLLNTENSTWEFDISDACQEVLRTQLAPMDGAEVFNAFKGSAQVECRFRSSGFEETTGFLLYEGIQPKQGTGERAPVSGSGTASETFIVVNATLQHLDNQDLLQHLTHTRTNNSYDADTYPLSHRRDFYRVCRKDSDHFAFLHLGDKTFFTIDVVTQVGGVWQPSVSYNIPQVCLSSIDNVRPTVLPGNDVRVQFESAGPAIMWEWTITNGSSWMPVYSTTFIISFADLLIRILTELGQEIITEVTGDIVIPEGVDIYDTYTIAVRPRCSNGAYGTGDNGQFTVVPIPLCAPPENFSLVAADVDNNRILFDIGLPDGSPLSDFQLFWRFAYGGGYETGTTTENHLTAGGQWQWTPPAGFINGTWYVSMRMKCGPELYSGLSNEVAVEWNKVILKRTVKILSILPIDAPAWEIKLALLGTAAPEDITVKGYFIANTLVPHTVNFTVIIPAGQEVATANLGYDANVGSTSTASNRTITSATPNPTSDGRPIDF